MKSQEVLLKTEEFLSLKLILWRSIEELYSRYSVSFVKFKLQTCSLTCKLAT